MSLRLSGGSRDRSFLETLAATLRTYLGLGKGQTSVLFSQRFFENFLGLKMTAVNLSSCSGSNICEERMPSKDVIFEVILAYGCEQSNHGASVGNDKLLPPFPNLSDYFSSIGFQLSHAYCGHTCSCGRTGNYIMSQKQSVVKGNTFLHSVKVVSRLQNMNSLMAIPMRQNLFGMTT